MDSSGDTDHGDGFLSGNLEIFRRLPQVDAYRLGEAFDRKHAAHQRQSVRGFLVDLQETEPIQVMLESAVGKFEIIGRRTTAMTLA
jgi:hypothetical protein